MSYPQEYTTRIQLPKLTDAQLAKLSVRISWTEVQLEYLPKLGSEQLRNSRRFAPLVRTLKKAVASKVVTERDVHNLIWIAKRSSYRTLGPETQANILAMFAHQPSGSSYLRWVLTPGNPKLNNDAVREAFRLLGPHGTTTQLSKVLAQSGDFAAYGKGARRSDPPALRLAQGGDGVQRGLELLRLVKASGSNRSIKKIWIEYEPGQHVSLSPTRKKDNSHAVLIVDVDELRGVVYIDYDDLGLWRCSRSQFDSWAMGPVANIVYQRTQWAHKLTVFVIRLIGDLVPLFGKVILGAQAASVVTYLSHNRNTFIFNSSKLDRAVKQMAKANALAIPSLAGGAGLLWLVIKAYVPESAGLIRRALADPQTLVRWLIKTLGNEAAERAVRNKLGGKNTKFFGATVMNRALTKKQRQLRLEGKWSTRRGLSWEKIADSMPDGSANSMQGLAGMHWNRVATSGLDKLAKLLGYIPHVLASFGVLLASFALREAGETFQDVRKRSLAKANEMVPDPALAKQIVDQALAVYYPNGKSGGRLETPSQLTGDRQILEQAAKDAKEAIVAIFGLLSDALHKAMLI